MLTPDQEKMREAAKACRGLKWMPPTEGYTDCGWRYREVLTQEGEEVFGEFASPNDEEAQFISLTNPAAILALLDQVEAQGEQYAEREYEIWQGGFVVAGTAGKGALKEARHYAMMYSQYGPCDIVEVTRRKLPPPPEAA